MQDVLQTALEQQPLTAEALDLLHKGHMHVLEMHADGTVTELLPADHPAPQHVAELRRFKTLVDTLQRQQVVCMRGCFPMPLTSVPQVQQQSQLRTARGLALGVCALLVVVVVAARRRTMSDWAAVWQLVRCRVRLCWRSAMRTVETHRHVAMEGAQGPLPDWKPEKDRGKGVAVRAVSGVRMPRARPGAGGSLDD